MHKAFCRLMTERLSVVLAKWKTKYKSARRLPPLTSEAKRASFVFLSVNKKTTPKRGFG